jgi:hypothetical protein
VRVYTVGLLQLPATRSLLRARAKAYLTLKQYQDAADDLKSLGDDDVATLLELAKTYRQTQQTLGELAVWRRIRERSEGKEREDAALMVKALQALAAELDSVSRPVLPNLPRKTTAKLARGEL